MVLLIVLCTALLPAGALAAEEIDPLSLSRAPGDDGALQSGTSGAVPSAEATTIWEGPVTVDPDGTFTIRPVNTDTDVEVDRNTPLGALDAAAEAGNFSYEIWEAEWGFYVNKVNDIAVSAEDNETTIWWFYDVATAYITNNATYKSLRNDEEIRLIYAPQTASFEQTVESATIAVDMTIRLAGEDTANFTAEPTSGPAPLTVQFNDTSTVRDVTSWFWDFGIAGATSTEQNPAFTYTRTGLYNVSLTVTDAQNKTSTATKEELIDVTPTNASSAATFSADVTAGEAPLTVRFTDLSTVENISSWYWDFGDGYMSTRQNPIYTYHEPGLFAVTLTLTDAENVTWNTSAEGFINVSGSAGTIGFTANRTSGSTPLAVQFTDLSTVVNISSWLWDFGDGNTSTEQNPAHAYTAPGSFDVNLTVYGENATPGREIKEDYITVTA
ncbi:MAG: PKD domain-containing protein [Methanofollis sp.]|uniref:PKD domain-containing protein n=1 Tax=Methanofollis sp. TaxID=2052835 RepID=UPI002605DF54|nr:PKD domain-containing protein [Methanofollis sp.]MDD4254326.1 PKD domain-containing protein [Methanofollis sp.]